MKRLFIADIHANLPALQAVLDHVGPVDEIIFLGDAIGFGPFPAECVELLRTLPPIAIRGNHDTAVLNAQIPPPNSDAARWNSWTLHQLSMSQRAYLQSLPPELHQGAETFLHHPAGAPYLHPSMPDSLLEKFFKTVTGKTIFFGHSHYGFERQINGRRFVCIPSVGQPRDGDPRAGYAVETSGVLSIHRVAYDIERTARAVARLPLSPHFLERWLSFLRTGSDPIWSRPNPALTAGP